MYVEYTVVELVIVDFCCICCMLLQPLFRFIYASVFKLNNDVVAVVIQKPVVSCVTGDVFAICSDVAVLFHIMPLVEHIGSVNMLSSANVSLII